MANENNPTDCPFTRAADTYFELGFSPFPIPPHVGGAPQKSPPPVGYTGHEGKWVTQKQIDIWKEEALPGTNIGIRLPKGLVGIDVDGYKGGWETLKKLEKELGELPPTWTSTSRNDGKSGIRLFTAPKGLAWAGAAGPGIDIISYQYRYMVVAPSIHPLTGKAYFWVDPHGEIWNWPED